MTATARSAPRLETVTPLSTPEVERSRTRRPPNRGRLMLGGLLVAMSALVAALVYSSTGDLVAVIGVSRNVAPGQSIAAEDLREVEINVSTGLDIIDVAQADDVIGRISTTRLVAGSLLTPDQIGSGPEVPAGSIVVGASLKPGQFPVGLAVGDDVRVIESSPPDASGVGEAVERGTATVLDIDEAGDGDSSTVVSLIVGGDDIGAVSSAGAAGRLSLAVVVP